MLVIRKEQMEALSKNKSRQFEDDMSYYLRLHFSQQLKEVPQAELNRLIREGIAKAQMYKIEQLDDIRRFLECGARFGWDFDTAEKTAWALPILQAENLNGSTKMDRINDYELFVLKGQI